MKILENLNFSLTKKVPIIYQTEAAECGLACIAMIASYYGFVSDLSVLRRRFNLSQKGSTLNQLVNISNSLKLSSRPIRLELNRLSQLKLPCVIHWNFNHFVVLEQVKESKIEIVDPAFGRRSLSWGEFSQQFTGIALELWPMPEFEKKEESYQLKISDLLGSIQGIWKSASQIILLAIVLEVVTLLMPLLLQFVIDYVIVADDRGLLLTLVLGFTLLLLLQQVILTLRSWLMLYMSTHINIQWRLNVFKHLINLPVSYFEKRSLGDAVSRFGSIDNIQRTLTTTFFEVVLDGLVSVITLILMFIYSPLLTLISISAILIYAITRWLWFNPIKNAFLAEVVNSTKQNSHFMESVRGAKPIKIFQRQEFRTISWQNLLVNQINANIQTQKLNIYFKLANGIIFGLENILIIWFGADLIMSNVFTLGFFMAFIAYKNQFVNRVSSFIDKIIELKKLRVDVDRLSDIVFTEPEKLYLGENSVTGDLENPTALEIKNLSFKYSDNDPYIVKNLNLTVPNNQSIVLTGPTGCGKTTLMNLIIGVLQKNDGEIKIFNLQSETSGVDPIRNMIGVVLQDDILFSGSIVENISFFDLNPDLDFMEECAKIAAIHDDIIKMPMGYRTLIGELGSIISGGQKQRILLARALYKRPKIIFLDEATSHLDIQKEAEVNKNLKLMNITKIMIAHRPETINSADRVIVLANGIIVQDFLNKDKN